MDEKNRSLLIVDDNAMNRKIFKSLLKETDFEIQEASSGQECLEMIQQKRYDIVFLDHMMPEMDGIEVLHEIKNRTGNPCENTPVIALTANIVPGAKEFYIQEGFWDFLEKPIQINKLQNLIEKIICTSSHDFEMDSSMEIQKDKGEFPIIEGLDWKYARSHFSNEDSMLDAIFFFCQSISYEKKELEKLYEDFQSVEGRKKYCTKIHSMKNSTTTIGIIPLAGMAKVLEDAARDGEDDIIDVMTPIFLKRWKAYEEHLSVLFPDIEKKSGKKAEEFCLDVQDILEDITVAAREMDIDALDALWGKISQYEFQEEQQDVIEKIRKGIMEFDVDFLQEYENIKLW